MEQKTRKGKIPEILQPASVTRSAIPLCDDAVIFKEELDKVDGTIDKNCEIKEILHPALINKFEMER